MTAATGTTASDTTTSGWRHRPVAVHTHTEVVALSLIAGAVLLVLVAGLAAGMPLSEAAPVAPGIVMPAVGAAIAWRFGTWGRIVGMAFGLVTVFMAFWLAFGLLVPASAVEFTAGVAFVVGVGLLLYAGPASIARRADVRAQEPRSEQRLDRAAVSLVVLAGLVSVPLWLANRTTVDPSLAAGLPTVAAANFAYDDVAATAVDGEATLLVENTDAFAHTFTIDALDVDVELLPGSQEIVAISAPAGTYIYYCIPHSAQAGEGSDDMAARLTIE